MPISNKDTKRLSSLEPVHSRKQKTKPVDATKENGRSLEPSVSRIPKRDSMKTADMTRRFSSFEPTTSRTPKRDSTKSPDIVLAKQKLAQLRSRSRSLGANQAPAVTEQSKKSSPLRSAMALTAAARAKQVKTTAETTGEDRITKTSKSVALTSMSRASTTKNTTRTHVPSSTANEVEPNRSKSTLRAKITSRKKEEYTEPVQDNNPTLIHLFESDSEEDEIFERNRKNTKAKRRLSLPTMSSDQNPDDDDDDATVWDALMNISNRLQKLETEEKSQSTTRTMRLSYHQQQLKDVFNLFEQLQPSSSSSFSPSFLETMNSLVSETVTINQIIWAAVPQDIQADASTLVSLQKSSDLQLKKLTEALRQMSEFEEQKRQAVQTSMDRMTLTEAVLLLNEKQQQQAATGPMKHMTTSEPPHLMNDKRRQRQQQQQQLTGAVPLNQKALNEVFEMTNENYQQQQHQQSPLMSRARSQSLSDQDDHLSRLNSCSSYDTSLPESLPSDKSRAQYALPIDTDTKSENRHVRPFKVAGILDHHHAPNSGRSRAGYASYYENAIYNDDSEYLSTSSRMYDQKSVSNRYHATQRSRRSSFSHQSQATTTVDHISPSLRAHQTLEKSPRPMHCGYYEQHPEYSGHGPSPRFQRLVSKYSTLYKSSSPPTHYRQ
ncbi:hypothetical protein EC973_004286 [Apophysomyces ossiformis]|uniref:Uncharacterized protein n=1 Tax=Apophysomyces ossiformis TaxID=679940 RepID=A0A8H7BGA7_9FUNG|nr:hypothetical protein EC973_004286 [Apophysomyces ossiformis]